MKIWHVLENAEEVKTMLSGKKYEIWGGVTTHPITFAPHVYIKVERWRDEYGEVVFIVPLELVKHD